MENFPRAQGIPSSIPTRLLTVMIRVILKRTTRRMRRTRTGPAQRPVPRMMKTNPDPGDVEADLDEILRDRIAANDDEDGEEEGEGGVTLMPASGDVEGRRESEIHCPNCFLLVTTDTVTNTGECPHCGGPFP